MSTLHIFSKPLNYYSANQLENLISLDDRVLLLGDACFASKQFKQFSDALLVLEEDAHVRAIKLSHNETPISYDEFVALTLTSTQLITW
ncbi:DsrH/TusB family sulfur metabolism protein [Pseudoalteromonas sp. H71]|jgi:tRNA 2-thiouridine synthesizing protein B|uniref:DsrH/TusB family sulfur metabolism protein n=1 Tax=Pseudoalteromonas sp. H71 TaxID=1348395 RepID=UPI0007302358|nr:DsrH/TusB family sulfur metabolism protein [Pseudoalteromonas sp. H71]KTD90277.1 tRNA 2-thiouridine-synthesizing protein [Pseudoalteromonas sp. H71]|tara:strand:- start:3253 stop:3519 length:267 start_codon:yes stop_codon:yes gene_type:complete